MEQTPQILPPRPAPNLDDIGTRYAHLQEFGELVEAVANQLNEKMQKQGLTVQEREKFIKAMITFEMVHLTIDTLAKYKDDMQAYKMARIIDQIPVAKNMEGYVSA
jgi:hypothetical protein